MDIKNRILEYIARYAPSREKITAYLRKKKVSDIETLLESIWYDEELMIELWMKTFLALGRWEREISMKLRLKGFRKEDIVRAIESYSTELHNWEEYEWIISLQIDSLSRKGKSKQMIYSLLRGRYPYFRDEIEELLEEMSDEVSLEKEVQKYKNKYNLSDPKDKQKCIAALIRKWYRYEDIRESLKSSKDE